MIKSIEGGDFDIIINRDIKMTYKGQFATFSYDEFMGVFDQSAHQVRVERLMTGFGQVVPSTITIPSEDVRLLRARLILEEAFETVEALGFDIEVSYYNDRDRLEHMTIDFANLNFATNDKMNLTKVIDGCCDTRVVVTGTLSAFGVKDEGFQRIVDMNNLNKLNVSTRDSFGKFIKPKGFVGPEAAIDSLIKSYGYS